MIRSGEIDHTLADVMTKAAAAEISDGDATSLTAADVTRVTEDGHYKIGDPERPYIKRDDGFAYNSKDSNWHDHIAKAEWLAKLRGAQILGHPPDATAMYERYWKNTGEPKEFNYEKDCRLVQFVHDAGQFPAIISRSQLPCMTIPIRR